MSMTGDRIRQARIEKRLTQEGLAKLISKSKQVISNWERGYSKPIDEDIAKLASLLDVSTDYLLGMTNLPQSSLSEVERDFINKIDLSDDELVKFPIFHNGRELTTQEKRMVIRTVRALLDPDAK